MEKVLTKSIQNSYVILLVLMMNGYALMAQLPDVLEVYSPKILGQYATFDGRVWNLASGHTIINQGEQVHLTNDHVFYSQGDSTFIHRSIDGNLVSKIAGNNFQYSLYHSLIWRYSNGNLFVYHENGEFISNESFEGENLHVVENELHYTNGNSIYRIDLVSHSNDKKGDFIGTFAAWFLDGSHFLTKQSSLVRLYDKNSNLIKLLDLPVTSNLGGNGNFFWTFPNSSESTSNRKLDIYQVNSENIFSFNANVSDRIIAMPACIAIVPSYGRQFRKIELQNTTVEAITENSIVDNIEYFQADPDGNWIISNRDGVAVFKQREMEPRLLSLGKVKLMSGATSGDLVVSFACEKVLSFSFDGEMVVSNDTFDINTTKIKITDDGKLLAASVINPSGNGASLAIYDLTTGSLVKEWYHGEHPNYENGALLDFDISDDGSRVSRKTGIWNGSKWSYANYLSHTHLSDSIYLNSDKIKGAPILSPGGHYALSVFVPEEYVYSPEMEKDFTKLYQTDGTLMNGFEGFSSGWISSDRLLLNSFESFSCRRLDCIPLYTPKAYKLDGTLDDSYIVPDSLTEVYPWTDFTIDAISKITEFEFFVNHEFVINNKTGKLLFAGEALAIVGFDHLATTIDNAIQLINWRARSTMEWYKDSDGDGYGDPSSSIVFYEQPEGYVSNGDDCNDADIDLTPLNFCDITLAESSKIVRNTAFPNPTTGKLTIYHGGQSVKIIVRNMQGQSVPFTFERDMEKYNVDMTNSVRGIYLLEIRFPRGTRVQKIVLK